MWWESGSENKESDAGGGNDVPVVPVPVLVPSQSVPPTNRQASPMPVVVPDVQDLKEQFQQQQNIITQIKETLKQNESQLSSKEKQVEAYANRLSQIKARSKTSQGKNVESTSSPSPAKTPTKKSSKENLTKGMDSPDAAGKAKLSSKGKVSELKKRLEENKIKFEERTGKELSDTKKIESLVENLQKQLEERDVTIQDLKKTIDTPPKAKSDTLPRRSKKENCASKSVQTSQIPSSEDSVEVMGLHNKIFELETTVMDLRECLKEKESIIEARTQAVTLLTQDLSIKGKHTLDNLEETRQEMRTMQSNFVVIQDQLQKELLEKEDRLMQYEEKNKRLESVNFDLSLKNAELQEKIVNIQTRNIELESEIKSLRESVTGDDRLEELSKKIEMLTKELDDSNKSMIKMKLEHKNKIKNLNKALEKVSSTSDEKGEIIKLERKVEELELLNEKLENKIVELEEEKGNLLLSVLDVDDFKAAESRLNNQIIELQSRIQQQNDDLDSHLRMIHNLESEKIDLMQANQDQNILIENLYAKIQTIETENNNLMELNSISKNELDELKTRIANMEVQFESKIEDLKAEHCKEIELIETYYNVKGEGVNKKELEEFRISNELNNIHVEEQIELLVREKQQLMEKLKNLSGVSSTDSLTFEKMEHSDLKDDKEATPTPEDDASDNRLLHLQRLTSEQQIMITDLQITLDEEKRKTSSYQHKITELEETIKSLEESNNKYKAQIETLEKAEAPSGPQKLNANTKNKIKKMQIELTENRRIVKEQNEKIKELNEKLEEKEELIKNYIEKIETYEKDDWGRENDWKTTKEDFDSVQELQKKCLSLENNLIELSEDCERLRKENIEIVHLLSEEKVQRKKLQDELERRNDLKDAETQIEEDEEVIEKKFTESMEESVEVLAKSVEIKDSLQESVRFDDLEVRIQNLNRLNEELEEKVRVLERNQLDYEESRERTKNLEESNKDLQEKLEWSNVVITSKETEIFRLQSLIEDHGKMIENLERDLKERNERLNEILEELSSKELQLEEISANFDKLKESVDVANQTIMTNESQLKDLLETVGRMEEDVSKKENELKEIKGILAEKNLDMTNLRERLEEVNSDLTVSYQEHLENMRKCLRDKETEYEELLTEKAHLEELTRNLILDKEDLFNQKIEILHNIEELEKQVEDKERIINELQGQLQAKQAETPVEDVRNKEIEDLKIKMKKLAANLKKKAQNEKDLLQQVKEFEEFVADKEKVVQKLQEEVKDVNEKWMMEKMEKEQEIAKIAGEKEALIKDNAELNQKIQDLESEYMNNMEKNEYKFQQMETQLQKMYENAERGRVIQEQDKATIADLERRFLELTQLYDNLSLERESQLLQLNEERSRSEILQQKLEELEKKYEGVMQEKGDAEGRVDGLVEQLEERNKLIENLERDVEEVRKMLGDVDGMKWELEERDKIIAGLQNQLKEAKRQLQEAEGMKVELEERNRLVQELGNEVAEVKRLLNELEGMKEERVRLENELGEVKKLFQEAEDKANWLEGEKRSLEEVKNSLTVQEEELRRRLESVMNELQQVMIDKEELFAKCNCLIDEKVQLEERLKQTEEKKPVKRKSVTFRTDEVEYIKELKGQIHGYNAELKKAHKEIEELKMELMRESMKCQVTEVILEAREKVESLKSLPVEKEVAKETEVTKDVVVEAPKESAKADEGLVEAKFDANTFFGTETKPSEFFEQIAKPESDPFNVDYDSLTWDDSWGTDGQLEEQFLTTKLENAPKSEEFKKLEIAYKEIENEKNDLLNLIKKNQNEYSKKLKEQKATIEALQAELNKLKNNSGFMGLDDAIIDELKSQISKLENRESELLKELQSSKVEKDNLLKRIDVLNAGNERFLEMKEKQDSEAQLWELKNKELLKEIADLRHQLENPVIDDENATAKENKELKNKLEGLEWELCELKELLEEKQEQIDGSGEKVMEEKSILQKEIEELNNVKEILEKKLKNQESAVEELQGQVSALAAENDSLQGILGEIKSKENEGNKIFDYFKSAPQTDFFASVAPQTETSELDVLKKEKETWIGRESELIKNYESLHETYQLSLKEAEWLRGQLEEISEACHVAQRRIAELEGELKERDERCGDLEGRIKDLEIELEERCVMVAEKDQKCHALQERINMLENVEREKFTETGEIERLQNRIIELEEQLSQSASRIDQLTIFSMEKANLEENIFILRAEIENLNRALTDEKLKTAEILHEREKLLEEINNLNNKLINSENKFQELMEEESRQKFVMDEYSEFRNQLERNVVNLQAELENSKLQLSTTRRELEELTNSKDEAISNLKIQLKELENELVENSEKKEFELEQLKCEIKERTNYYENLMENKSLGENKDKEELDKLRNHLKELGNQLETLKSELRVKDNDIFEISQLSEEEQKQIINLRDLLEQKDSEIRDLKETLRELQDEISHFRNFEKQVKELRQAQIRPNAPVTTEGDPDLTDWSEHELAELNTRLQSDLDTALYMLHQRDVRCDELTFELMQLLEERDTLQLRLSTAIRINEEYKSRNSGESALPVHDLHESINLADQSNDRQSVKPSEMPKEDLNQLQKKISELHSVGYIRDKTLRDESVQRHREQMSLLGRVSDSDMSLSRDVQSPPTVLLNWIKGKTTPKVMHI